MQEIDIGKTQQLDYLSEEEYKSLRTNIQFCGKEVKVIAVTSCIPDEGKSSVTVNLAKTIAETGKKVLFVDCDMRKSVLANRLHVRNGGSGLSHYLSGNNELDEVLCKTNLANLYMILSGPIPPNPSELLGSSLFKNFIRVAKEKFDYVLLDTPPLGSVTDAAVVSQVCDGMLMVLSAGGISYKMAQSVKNQIEKTGCRLLGVVLNKVQIKKNGYYGRYYGKYYTQYQSEDNGGR
ncbi:MAG: CpsD/CapB family tyrosine-protein kinase [Lachnospiraceae bacterium]